MTIRSGAALLAVLLALSACGPGTGHTVPPSSVTVTVAAASDLRFALDEIVEAYEADRPDVDVVVTYGSSGNFAGQIENGAPFDVFLSADIDYARRLETAGLAPEGATRPYAIGRLAVWVRAASPLDVEALGLEALLDPSVRRIAIANPEHAPYGRAAVAALRHAGIHDRVTGRLVLGENVSQAAQFVESGAAEIGIIALSLALAPTLAGRGRHHLVPEDAHPRIEQGALVLDRAVDPAAAAGFLDHVLGPAAGAVLERYGFAVPAP